ncbi:MAG: efflux RND transporter periplasmic adaptor subunit [Aquabacterium sp.]
MSNRFTKTRMRQLLLCASIWLGHASAIAHGPEGDHDHAEDKAPASSAVAAPSKLMRLPDGSVNVPKLAQRRMGVRTQVTQIEQVAATVTLPGRVIVDPNHSGLIQSAHGGRIEAGPQGLPVAGQAVKQGDVLAWIRHHADPYARAAQESQQAELRATRQLAEQKLRRLQSLEGTVARKDLEAAELELRALAQREQSVAQSLNAREALLAPLDGVIARSDLQVGKMVGSEEILVTVVNPRHWLVEATTTDPSLGQQVQSASLANGPSSPLKLQGAARALRDGVLPLTFKVTGEAATSLALGQTVSVIVQRSTTQAGVVVPADAVVRQNNNEPTVWVKVGPERFAPQPVQTQVLDGQRVLITRGLHEDQRVVTQGAALIAQIR